MSEKAIKPYGLWPSPITPESQAQSLRLAEVGWDSDGETLVWLEGRSDRGVLVCGRTSEAPRDLTPTISVRARVGYGGGDFTVGGGHAYFVAQEGRLYRQPLAAGDAQPITPQFGHMASPTLSPDGRWVIFVHTYEGVDCLAIVDAEGKLWPQKLAEGTDFVMQPCWHPDGEHIAWVSWNHPDMPWDHTTLQIARLDTQGPGLPTIVEREAMVDKPDVSAIEPAFSPDGRSLAYLCNESGWRNLYLYDRETDTHRQLTDDAVEIGRPTWAQGIRSHGFSADGERIYYVRNEAGFTRLWAYDLARDRTAPAAPPLDAYTGLFQIAVAPKTGRLAFLASSSTTGGRVIGYLPGGERAYIHRRGTDEHVPAADLATPQPLEWTADDGTTVHGLYYAPTSSRFKGTGLPPAIVHIHGGPTGQATARYDAQAQFFATRGYGFLTVNYRGSTGYGKAYMAALRGKWGILDVEDAIGGARYMVDTGLADLNKLVIMGGSAGGYTVLKALVDHPGFFKAALCLYGVSNMFTLAADTHKLEAHYLDSLLGPLPEAGDVYRERSPIFSADQIVDPIAVFQGEIDRVVPKAQAETIVASLRRRGVPHEYHLYEGEGHGWRKQETIAQFYGTVERFLREYVIFA
jgi:dipeptidyl aminopeptidase/acylaminoacyl peptidase